MVGSWLAIAAAGIALLVGGSGCDRPPEKQEKKYSASIHKHVGDKTEVTEKKFDLTQPADNDELLELFATGEVEELKKEKDINILAISWDLGLWTLVVFGLLLYVLRRLAWKPMLQGLHNREARIREALDEARRARDEAQSLEARLQKQMDQAQDKVRQILEEARRDAHRNTDEMLTQTRAEIQTERDRLRREIEMARDQALHQIWTQTAQLASQISAKAIHREVNVDDHRRLVDEAIAEMGQAADGRKRELAGV
jgi:F-type H+-transporting ATPase subunit b